MSELRDGAADPAAPSATGSGLTRDAAIDRLARRLYEAMERLDPLTNEPMIPWESLSDRQREFYRLCVNDLVEHGELILATLISGGHRNGRLAGAGPA